MYRKCDSISDFLLLVQRYFNIKTLKSTSTISEATVFNSQGTITNRAEIT